MKYYQDALFKIDFKDYSQGTQESLRCWNPDRIDFNLIEHLLCQICERNASGAVLVFMTGWDDINSLRDKLQAHHILGDPTRVLLLACHGSMASSEQVCLSINRFCTPYYDMVNELQPVLILVCQSVSILLYIVYIGISTSIMYYVVIVTIKVPESTYFVTSGLQSSEIALTNIWLMQQ